MPSLVYPYLSRQYQHTLIFCYALALLEACVVYAQTISDNVGQASLQLVLPQLYLVYHHSGHTSISTYASPPHLTVEHVAF